MAVVQRKDLYTPLKKQPEYFSDFLVDFELLPVKNDLQRNLNEEAIKRSITNLLLTRPGERLFNQDLGSNIHMLLFEQYSPAHDQILEDQIRTTIANYEPRANVTEVAVSFDDVDRFLTATIVFTMINKIEPITLDLVLNRIR